MKSKRILIFIFVLLSAFMFNTNRVFALDISVKDIRLDSKGGSTSISEINYSGNTINFSIVFNSVNDYVKFKITLDNKDNEKYIIDSIKDNNTNDNLDVSYSYDDKTIKSKGTKDIYVTLKYNKKVTNKNISLNDLNITLDLLDAKGNNNSVIINPTTRDNIKLYTILFIVGLITILFSFLLIKRRKVKGLFVLLLVLVPTVVIAKEKLSVDIIFTNVTIKGEIVTYTVEFNSNGGSNIDSVNVNPGESIATFPTPEREDYKFEGWYTGLTDGTKVTEPFTPQDNVTLYAHWTYDPFPIKFIHTGACTFNGPDGTITGSECSEYVGKQYIDTKLPLYSSTNYSKDYEIGFVINSYGETGQPSLSTLLNTKDETGNKECSGLVYRIATNDKFFETSQFIYSNHGKILTSKELVDKVTIVRKDGNYYYSYNDGFFKLLQNKIDPPDTHNVNTWFGSSQTNKGLPMRQFIGTLSNMYIRMGKYPSDSSTITFDPNGGTVSETSRVKDKLVKIGTLPQPEKEGYIFKGWWTKKEDGELANANTLVNKDVTLYAKWVEKGAVVEYDGTYYDSLAEAIDAVHDNEEATITFVDNVSANVIIPEGKNIILDIGEYTLSNLNNEYIIQNNGKLTIHDGKINTNAENAAAINNFPSGQLFITGGRINASVKQAVYNKGGKVTISGDAYLSSSSLARATIQSLEDTAELNILGGTILSTDYYALKIERGTANIGTNDTTLDIEKPLLQGKIYAVFTNVNFSMYDGLLKGGTDTVDKPTKLTLRSDLETVTGNELIDGIQYSILYLKNRE